MCSPIAPELLKPLRDAAGAVVDGLRPESWAMNASFGEAYAGKSGLGEKGRCEHGCDSSRRCSLKYKV